MKKLLYWLVACSLLLLLSPPAKATLGGKQTINTGTVVSPLYIRYFQQASNETWLFRTVNCNGADSVIHVQNASTTDRAFVAGNDDTGVEPEHLASSVSVPNTGLPRTLAVIVRAYNSGTEGQCDFVSSSSLVASSTERITLGAGTVVSLGDLAATTHVITTRPPLGSSDTVLLLFSGSHGYAFSDDDGLEFLSYVNMNTACPSCLVMLANYGKIAPLLTNLIWDQEYLNNDSDFDGVGNTLETSLGLRNDSIDSDLDGLTDSAELYGEDLNSPEPPLNFPMWGADPAQKDLFVEVDWATCTVPDCKGNLDYGRFGMSAIAGNEQANTDALLQDIQDRFPATVRVHLDVGHSNTNANTQTRWGNWGGAIRQDNADPGGNNLTGCENAPVNRRGRFHFAVSMGPGAGWTQYMPGSCMRISNAGGDALEASDVFVHETGHSLGLAHSGRDSSGPNFRTNYPSIMNYAYEASRANYPGFSLGQAATLNPVSLDETIGIGAVPSPFLGAIKNAWCPNGTCVNTSTGAIDWNRDGVISPSGTKVQGAIGTQDFSTEGVSLLNEVADSAMTWVSAGGTVGDRLYIFGRSTANVLQVISQKGLAFGPGAPAEISPSLLNQNRTSNLAGFGTPPFGVPQSLSKILAYGPGAAEVGPSKMIVVWQGTTGTLKSNLLTIGSNGVMSVASDVTLPNAMTAVGDVTAVATAPGVVRIWAPSGSNPVRLRQWTYQSGLWTGPLDQQWADGTNIVPQYGIGATMGFQDDSGIARLYALIPTGPSGTVEFARQETSGVNAGRWTKLSAFDLFPKPTVFGRPGLAYQHRFGQANSLGRFYMVTTPTCATCLSTLQMTEGNLTSGPTRRLEWLSPIQFGIDPQIGGVTLLNDLTRDSNLRAMTTQMNGTTKVGVFRPIADGIYNSTMKDHNDFPYVTGALRASLALDGGATWPQGILPASLNH